MPAFFPNHWTIAHKTPLENPPETWDSPFHEYHHSIFHLFQPKRKDSPQPQSSSWSELSPSLSIKHLKHPDFIAPNKANVSHAKAATALRLHAYEAVDQHNEPQKFENDSDPFDSDENNDSDAPILINFTSMGVQPRYPRWPTSIWRSFWLYGLGLRM